MWDMHGIGASRQAVMHSAAATMVTKQPWHRASGDNKRIVKIPSEYLLILQLFEGLGVFNKRAI